MRLLRRLHGKRVWLFHSGPLGANLADQKPPGNVRKLIAQLSADTPKTFPGRLEVATAEGFFARKMAQGEMAGDYRDWKAIAAWADDIANQLVS